MSWADDDEDDDLDVEGPEDDEDETTAPCPYCHAPVYDDAERCPSCGRYLSKEDAPRAPKPWWIVLGALAALAAMLWWVLRP